MNSKKISYKLLIWLLISCFCIASIMLIAQPQKNEALSLNSFTFEDYAADGIDECGTHTDNIVINKSGSVQTIDFWGHYSRAYFEFAVANPGNDVENAFFNFTINEETTDWHTLEGSGFFFNGTSTTDPAEGSTYTAYYVRYENSKVGLYKVKFTGPLNTPNFTLNRDYDTLNASYTLIKSVNKASTGVHEISIQSTQNHVVYMDNNVVLFDEDITPTGGNLFGPAVQWGSHGCTSCSHIQYTDVLCGINAKKPVADFDYNTPVADIRNPVTVIDASKDMNTPATALTYYWTVNRIEEDGSRTNLLKDSPVPFTQYNASGIGTYETILKVQNEYRFFSEEVTKIVEIISVPEIQIVADKAEYEPGQKVTFKCDKWYNCSSKTNDVTIKNVVSPKLFNVEIALPGSNDISNTTGDIQTYIKVEYKDGTNTEKTITIPATGSSFTDTADKEISNITIIYKGLPKLATVNTGKYITYTYTTKNPLSNYYVGGATTRRYEITNSATISVPINSSVTTKSDSATTKLIEKTGSFSLKGTVDNKNAITKAPECNTEFMLSGTSYGGENITKFIAVNKGISGLTELPYGEYTLNEEDEFTLGYDRIAPISIIIDSKGITIDKKNTVADKGAVPFVKPIQVTKINVKRIYESVGGIPLNSDVDFKVQLTGTTVIKNIPVSFELTSLKDDPIYKYNNMSDLILPIGTFNVKETQSFDLVILDSINVNDELAWNIKLNSNKSYTVPNSSFVSSKDLTTSVVLKYISQAYYYDETVYENELIIKPKLLNNKLSEISENDINQVLQNPQYYSYPVKLTDVEIGAEYVGIATAEQGAMFKYMTPGKYKITLNNNMFMDIKDLVEVNSSEMTFTKEGNDYFVVIPEKTSSISLTETQTLTDWRGYSSISFTTTPLYTDVATHVSFTLKAVNQDGNPIKDSEFQFYNEKNELMYFIKKDRKLYPVNGSIEGAISNFKTNELGEIKFFKFPVGKFTIKQINNEGNLNPQNEIETIIVTGNNNVGIKISQIDATKLPTPSSLMLSTLKKEVDINETLRIASRIMPNTAYKNVTFKTSDPNVLTVSADGVITGKSKGTAKVSAVSNLNNQVVAELEIKVKDPANPDMTALHQYVSNIKLAEKETYQAKAVFSPLTVKNPTITWSAKDDTIASVSATGLITGKKAGTTDIIATCGEYTAICRVTVGKVTVAPKSIQLNKKHIELIYNNVDLCESQIEAVITPDNVSDASITYQSSDSNVVSVDANGTLTAKKAGTAVITATTSNGLSDSCVVSSVAAITKISPNITEITVVKGKTVQIVPNATPKSAVNSKSLSWKSLDTSVATVDKNGLVTTIGLGETTIVITASYPGMEDVIAECKINVASNVVTATNLDVCLDENFETFTFAEATRMQQDGSFEFFARVRPASTTDPEIIWTYSKENIVAVAPADPSSYSASNPVNKFKLAAIGTEGGEVTVTGTVKGTEISNSFKVIVDSKGTGFTFSKSSPQKLILGKTNNDTVSIAVVHNNQFSAAKKINWSLSDDSIVEMNVNSATKKEVTLVAKQVGTTKLKADVEYWAGGTYTEEMDIVVESPRIDVLVDGNPVTEINIAVGETKYLVVEPNYKKDSADDGYQSSSVSFVSIEGATDHNTPNGLGYKITGVSDGTETITFTPTDTTCAPVTITFKVGTGIHKSITLSLDTDYQDDTNGTIKIKATTENIEGTIQFSSSDESIATIDENGIITILATGKVTITATADGVTQTLEVDVNLQTNP